MQQPFNPYVEWLDFEEDRRPSNHYELLGIEPEQRDPDTIARAADVLTSRVRSVRPGEHLMEWQLLLDELREAKRCLADPAAREAYDAALRGQPAAAPPPGPQIATPPPTIPQLASPPGLESPSSTPSTPASQPDASVPPPGTWGQAPTTTSPPADPNSPPGGPQQTPPDVYAGAGTPPPCDGPGPQPQVPPNAYITPVPTSPGPPDPYMTQSPNQQGPSQSEGPAGIEGWQTPPGQGQTLPVGTPVPSTARVVVVGGSAAGRKQKRRSAWRLLALLAVATLVVVVFGLFRPWLTPKADDGQADQGSLAEASGVSKSQPESPDAPRMEEKPAAAPAPESTDQPGTAKEPRQPVDPPKPQEKPAPREPADASKPTNPAPPEPTVNPQKEKAFRRAVEDARVSMSEHDLVGVRQFLDEAAKHLQTPEEQAELDRLDTLLGHLESFWDAVCERVAGLDAGVEFTVRDTVIVVVEGGRDRLIIRAQGRNRTYRIEEIPHVLVEVLLEGWLGNDPASNVVLGAYLAVDPDGNKARARQLWTLASQQGMDVQELFPELDRMPVSSDSSSNAARTPPPSDEAVLKRAEQEVKEQFRAEYAQATTAARQSALARKLLAQAGTMTDDPDVRFVMLRDAQDIAIKAGEPQLACQVIDEMAGAYSVDALERKLAALEQAAETVRGLKSHREIAQSCLGLLVQAVESERLEEAERLAALAASSAEQSKSTQLILQARAAGQQVEAMRKRRRGE